MSSLAVHLSGPYCKIRTVQGTNQNAPLRRGPVCHIIKDFFFLVVKLSLFRSYILQESYQLLSVYVQFNSELIILAGSFPPDNFISVALRLMQMRCDFVSWISRLCKPFRW